MFFRTQFSVDGGGGGYCFQPNRLRVDDGGKRRNGAGETVALQVRSRTDERESERILQAALALSDDVVFKGTDGG